MNNGRDARPAMGRRELGPVADIGDPFMLIGSSGPVDAGEGTFLWEILGIEMLPSLFQGGELIIWNDTTAQAGYASDPNAATGHIAAGGNKTCTPLAFSTYNYQVVQFRTRVRGVDITGPVITDMDLTCNLPAASGRWQLQNAVGVLNAKFQVANPADSVDAPAQGADMGLSTINIGGALWDSDYLSELWSMGNQQTPQFTINNHGVITSGGSIALECAGIAYNVRPIKPGPAGVRSVHFAGSDGVLLPNDFTDDDLHCLAKVQIASRTTAQ